MENKILIIELFEQLAKMDEELSTNAIEALANALVSVFETNDVPYIVFSHDDAPYLSQSWGDFQPIGHLTS